MFVSKMVTNLTFNGADSDIIANNYYFMNP